MVKEQEEIRSFQGSVWPIKQGTAMEWEGRGRAGKTVREGFSKEVAALSRDLTEAGASHGSIWGDMI